MNLPTGHTECYFLSGNRFTTTDFEAATKWAISQMLKGWKVGIEQDTKNNREYTVYWGA